MLLKSRHFRTNSRQTGFTLIEIMIVLTLLGLIATFAVTNYRRTQCEGYQKAAKIELQNLKLVLDDFQRVCNSYPTSAQGLQALIAKPADLNCSNFPVEGFYSKKRINQDPWRNEYVYVCDDGKHITALKSLGADGKEGGDGCDKDVSYDE